MSRMRNILEYLEESTERFPEKTAVTDGICAYNYRELSMRSRRIGSAVAARCFGGQCRRRCGALGVDAVVRTGLLFGDLPLGVFQDVASWAGGKRRKNRFTYSRALPWLRYGMLALFVAVMVAHIKPVAELLAP